MMNHAQTPATATIETCIAPYEQFLGVFRIEVTGALPNDYVRIYTIRAKDERAAVFEAFEKFHDEISALPLLTEED